MDPIRVGRVPPGSPTPYAYVTVEYDGRPFARIDAYVEYEGPFTKLILWRTFVVLGLADVVHFIDPALRVARSVHCDFYFAGLYPADPYLLIASASELICVDERCARVWRRDDLGIDGVVVDSIAGGRIKGQGEWDPPGGWRPFCVALETGLDHPPC